MKTAVQIFLKQTCRSTGRLILQLVLLCATIVFFAVSLNLFANSTRNLQTVEDTYKTIATMEIYGYVDRKGNLVHPGNESSVGYHWLSVEDYDLSPLLALDSVKSIDLRTRVGAYIPGHLPVISSNERLLMYADSVNLCTGRNIIRFVLDSDVPMEISLQEDRWLHLPFPIRVLETSNPNLQYSQPMKLCVTTMLMQDAATYQEDIRRLNRSDITDRIILYPDVEYIFYAYGGDYWVRNPETGIYTCSAAGNGFCIDSFHYYTDAFLYYRNSGIASSAVSGISTILQNMPFGLQRYEDVKDDPVWQECRQAAEYSEHSFSVTLTEDISLIPAWYQGAMYLQEGRMITKKEYMSGANVCMVSAQMAEYQGWQIGDTLDMHLYTYDAFIDETSVIRSDTNIPPIPQNYIPSPFYLKECGGFLKKTPMRL